MDSNFSRLFEPMEQIKQGLKDNIKLLPGGDVDKPGDGTRKMYMETGIWPARYNKGMCHLLAELLKLQKGACLDEDSLTTVEAVLLNEIKLMEERLRGKLPIHERVPKECDMKKEPQGLKLCYFDTLLNLESVMREKYKETTEEIKKEANAARNRSKKERRRASKLQQQASAKPEKPVEADDGKDVVTEQASAEPGKRGEAGDGLNKKDDVLDKKDVEQACIPKPDFKQFSEGDLTNYGSFIFKGELTIPVPLGTDEKPIPLMYFKMEEGVYWISGYYWASFSMNNPSQHLLSVNHVGETVDGKYFIACETFQQPLSAWLEDQRGAWLEDQRSRGVLSSTSIGFLKDVLIGAAYVHTHSNGSLIADLCVENIYIVNEQAKLSWLTHKRSAWKDVLARFDHMVRVQVFPNIPIPIELDHLLHYGALESISTWHHAFVTYPLFLSPSQRCVFVELAFQRISEYQLQSKFIEEMNLVAKETRTLLGVLNVDWIANVKHEALLPVLRYKKKNQEKVKELEEGDAPVEKQMKEFDYENNSWSFFVFCWNVIVHMSRFTLTDEQIISLLDEISPNFLVRAHQALTRLGIFISVGEDSTF